MADVYRQVNSILKQVNGSKITSYERISSNVVSTGYDNGKTVIVNYGNTAYESGTITVPAKAALVY